MQVKVEKIHNETIDVCDLCHEEVKRSKDFAGRVKEYFFGYGFMNGGGYGAGYRLAHTNCYDKAIKFYLDHYVPSSPT